MATALPVRSPRGRLALVALLGTLALLYQVRAIDDIVRALRAEDRARAPFQAESTVGRIQEVRKEAEEAGLHPGDRVVSIAGRPYQGRKTVADALRGARAGDVLPVGIERLGVPEEVHSAVRLAANQPKGGPLEEATLAVALGIVLPVVSLALGVVVAILRPRDSRALLLLLMMMSFAQLPGTDAADEAAWGPVGRVVGTFYDQVMEGTWGIWMMLFGLAFPTRLGLDRRWPWVKWLLIGPLAVLALAEALATVSIVEGIAAAAPLVAFGRAMDRSQLILTMIAVSSFFASLGFKGGTAASPDDRRRLVLLYAGAAVGLTPTFLLVVASLIAGRPDAISSTWFVLPTLLSMLIFPLSLAYAIVVHRAMDLRVVVRQGLQYALARRGVMALQVAAIAVAIFAASTLAGGAGVNRPRRIQYLAGAIIFVFGIRRVAERARAWIDTRFFREAYDAEQILTALSEDVRTIVDTDTLLTTVGQRVATSLHVQHVAALLRQDGAYAPAYRLGPLPEVRLSADSRVAAHLRESREPLRVNLADPASWVSREAGPEDRAALAALESELLLPLAVKDTLLGILSLGPKRSEEPYSPSDVRLLQSVAAQTAIALENSQLTAEIARATALRARMDREIEIAREVQEGLFPQHYPPVPGLEYVGFCRPALGVGGDYYDFVKVGEKLGIAVGDISGKGIPAALLMASLQASLRAQAISAPVDLATLMARLNELIYENSPANRYATFFYGQYEPGTRRLRYVNAGHNAPMVFRPGTGGVDLLRIEGGGPVIGLLPSATYTQFAFDLFAGDLLVGYTDGVSEAMNPDDEEWGEERMAEAVRGCLGLHPKDIVPRVMAAADDFAHGARQHDDMTLVVLRVT
ncbi:MAG TPA: SpoIIE family protein phosphatase [Vicinamibacteria bacterium]